MSQYLKKTGLKFVKQIKRSRKSTITNFNSSKLRQSKRKFSSKNLLFFEFFPDFSESKTLKIQKNCKKNRKTFDMLI